MSVGCYRNRSIIEQLIVAIKSRSRSYVGMEF
jgi:hypothetical protein